MNNNVVEVRIRWEEEGLYNHWTLRFEDSSGSLMELFIEELRLKDQLAKRRSKVAQTKGWVQKFHSVLCRQISHSLSLLQREKKRCVTAMIVSLAKSGGILVEDKGGGGLHIVPATDYSFFRGKAERTENDIGLWVFHSGDLISKGLICR